ncbi:YihD family protein [uncultured Endozoicomonas sp.]|uniref:YihD family protein n=1 Tax=uncultured Endozoicomonas sp. TaxID=432652 RepID=UPI0026249C71|nr:YihD family protein [uncultured Endozoicomonas sp.]
MSCHRINELAELLMPEWQKQSHLNLVQIIESLASEAGHKGPLNEVTDDILIYHLKMKGETPDAMIPGIAKDVEVDFKAALLKARGIT